MAVRVLLVLTAFAVLYGCGQASSPPERQEEQGGVEHARQPEPPEYRLQGTYEGWITLDDGREYEALMVENAEPEGST